MALQLQGLLEKIGLIHHVLAFVKDEGSNLGFMVMALQSIVDIEPLKMLRVYEGTCFGHVMFKVCQYTINDDKVSTRLTLMSVKDAHARLQKTNLDGWTSKLPVRRVLCLPIELQMTCQSIIFNEPDLSKSTFKMMLHLLIELSNEFSINNIQ
jgi:hypothetical protein